MVTTASDTWGISGPDFLLLYAVLFALAAAGVWLWRHRLLGPHDPRAGAGELGAYDLAMLNGGAPLAITTASAKLHQDGLLRPGTKRRTLVTEGRLEAGADPLEWEVLQAVAARPGISTRTLRGELEAAPSIARRRAELTAAGLLVEAGEAARARALCLPLAAIAALGVARIAAGAGNGHPTGYLTVMVMVSAAVVIGVARRPGPATQRGRALLAAARAGRPALARSSAPADVPFAVALFGAGTLWISDPAFASTWGAHRETAWASGAGGGCGGGGCGGGGCGG
jgi:uncharacterized protein (TIGR04222 family)